MYYKIKNTLYTKFVMITFSFLLIVGCQNSQEFKNSPGKTYAQSLEELNIIAVFPPREDFQVGDVFVTKVVEGEDKNSRKSIYLTSVEVKDEILKFLKSRFEFSDTAAISGSDTVTTKVQDAIEGKELFSGNALRTLPIHVFPEIEIVTGQDIGLGASAPSSISRFLFGAGRSQKLRMLLSFDNTKSYSVPAPIAQQKLLDLCKVDKFPILCYDKLYYQDLFASQFGSEEVGPTTYSISLITQVYLTRKINYKFADRLANSVFAKYLRLSDGDVEKNRIFSEKISAIDSNKISNTQTITTQINQYFNSDRQSTANEGISTGTATAEGISAINSQLDRIQEKLSQVVPKSSEVPAAGLSANSFNSESIVFSESFAKPVAIGYRAVRVVVQ